MRKSLQRGVVLLLVTAFFFMLPVQEAPAADEEEGLNKGALIGLFVVIVGVLAWVGFRSDMDRYFSEVTPASQPENGEAPETPILQLGSAPLIFNADGMGVQF